MTEPGITETRRERHSTGVPGLDTVLSGGLLSGAVYIVRGSPGAGKTILSNQICFHYVARGQRCLYVTLLAESHDRLVSNLEGMNFYSDESASSITYESGFDTLERDGLKGILRLLLAEAKKCHASLIVLDGLFALQEKVDSERELRLFVNQLQSLAHVMGSTILLLTNSVRGEGSPEFTMVDGWLELGMEQHDYRVQRYLQVHKYRGSSFLTGQHSLTISDDGIRVLPRLESHAGSSRRNGSDRTKLSTGIETFDSMVEGGLRRGSMTLVIGPTGIGKTTFGMHFVSQSTPEEPGLVFGFYESDSDLQEKAEVLGIRDFTTARDNGALDVLWQAPTEHLLDELGYILIEAVRRRGVKRLLVDGVDALQQSALNPERVSRFLAALTNELRCEGVTTVFTLETHQLIGGEIGVHFSAISPVAQNIVLMRYTEISCETRRAIGVIKARTSGFDPTIREFTISGTGLQVGDRFTHTDDVMTGHAHPHRHETDRG